MPGGPSRAPRHTVPVVRKGRPRARSGCCRGARCGRRLRRLRGRPARGEPDDRPGRRHPRDRARPSRAPARTGWPRLPSPRRLRRAPTPIRPTGRSSRPSRPTPPPVPTRARRRRAAPAGSSFSAVRSRPTPSSRAQRRPQRRPRPPVTSTARRRRTSRRSASPVTAGQVPLADWGTLTLDAQDVERGSTKDGANYSGSVTAIDIHLTLDHGGLPAGSEIQIGYAEVIAHSLPPAPPKPTTTAAATTTATTTTTPRPTTTTTTDDHDHEDRHHGTDDDNEPRSRAEAEAEAHHDADAREARSPARASRRRSRRFHPASSRSRPSCSPALERWPVRLPGLRQGGLRQHATASSAATSATTTASTSSASSASRSSRWPTARSSRSAGTTLGGNRLWLRDRQGNAFYYAHLSAFSTLVFNGAHVRAGQVVGFMGNTGDAEGDADAPPLRGAPRLDALPRLRRRRRPDAVPRRRPAASSGCRSPCRPAGRPSATGSNAAPQPGAVLLSVSDISTADGLDPDSLRRAIEAPHAAALTGSR